MKNNNKKLIMVAIIFSALIHGECAYAKVRAVMSRRDFERNLSHGGMVVALFYEDQKGNDELRRKNKNLFDMYADLSNYQPYNDADIIFLKVNIGRKELAELAELYGVTATPTFLFFRKGQHLRDASGHPISKEGFVSRADIQSVITKCCSAEIENYVVKKEERRNQIIEQENESWKPYFYPRDMVVRGYAPEERQENME
jgi:thioredoxin-related protein